MRDELAGLQVEGGAEVRRIVSGVTASRALIEAAIADGADGIRAKDGKRLTVLFVDFQGNREKRLDILTILRRQLRDNGVEVRVDVGQLGLDVVQQPVELRLDRRVVGLVVHRVQHRLDRQPHALGRHAHEVGGVVRAAALPGRPGQRRPNGRYQPGMGVAGDQFDPGQAAGGQRPPERQPARSVLGGTDVNTQDFAMALGVDPDRDQGVHVDHPPALADLEHQGVGGHERVRAGVQGPGAEGFDGGVEFLVQRAQDRAPWATK